MSSNNSSSNPNPMSRVDQHLLLDRAVLTLHLLGPLTDEEQDYLSELRETLWKKMDGKEAEELEARWRMLQGSVGWRKGEPPEGMDEALVWATAWPVAFYQIAQRKRDGRGFSYWNMGNLGAWHSDWLWIPLPLPPEKKT